MSGVHDVGAIEQIVADRSTPVRLRRALIGVTLTVPRCFLRLVLLDVIGKRELSAADRGLLIESVDRPRQTNATCLRWST